MNLEIKKKNDFTGVSSYIFNDKVIGNVSPLRKHFTINMKNDLLFKSSYTNFVMLTSYNMNQLNENFEHKSVQIKHLDGGLLHDK